MKKVLFATTALFAGATVASADIANMNLSGYGRFGIGYNQDRSTNPNVSDTILISRFRLNIDANAETDGGVQFSARVRLQADEDAGTGEAGAAALSGARFSAIYGGLRVDVGNVSGAIDNLANYYGNEPGLEFFIGQYAGVDYEFLSFSSTGAGANAVFFQYAVGDFAFGASYDQNSTLNGNAALGGADSWDVSATYTFNNITAALAYGQTDGVGGAASPSLTVLTLGGDFGDLNATLFVADDSDTPVNGAGEATDGTAYGLSLAYNIGSATTVNFAYGDGSADGDTQQYGVGFIYDLGGGVSMKGGVGRTKVGNASGTTRADFGVNFNF